MERQVFDAAYLDRLRSGDPETEKQFVAYFRHLILAKARVRLRCAISAEDVCQETLLRVFRAVRATGGIRSPEGLGAFVNSVCTNVLHEFLRTRDRFGPPPPEDPGRQPADSGPTAEERILSDERCRQVHQVIAGLSQRDQRLLRALFLEDHERDELCAAFGVGRDYLRVLVHRAKGEFRSRFLEAEAAAPESVRSGAAAPRGV